ncbi:MAG: hypothetical protein U1F65_00170 [Verrucomicrobiota bacterium]
MMSDISILAGRLSDFIAISADDFSSEHTRIPAFAEHADIEFNGLAVMLFTLQFKFNLAYRRLCEARRISPAKISHWRDIPCVPTLAFKELDLTSLVPAERTRVFHSSGTTGQKPSRHFHSAESLALYETSAMSWFRLHVPRGKRLVILTPPPAAVPHSSLVHMFDGISREASATSDDFVGRLSADGEWCVDFVAALAKLQDAIARHESVTLLGTAFSFVHLLDHLAEQNQRLRLPAGSRVMETGGYKNKSRSLAKADLHRLISERLGVEESFIHREYGMSELSSQAYDTSRNGARHFQFPPWARVRVVSPETGKEVADGETGLLCIYDLANAFSVMAIQTEDLAVRRGGDFELAGRAALSEPRGCSLMSAP